MTRTFTVAVVLACLCLPAGSVAHTRSESYSNWTIDGNRAIGTVTVSSAEVITLMTTGEPRSLESLMAAHLRDTVTITGNGDACRQSDPVALAAPRGFLRIELSFACESAPPDAMTYRALMDRLPAHVHYLRVFESGQAIAEQVLTDRNDSWSRETTQTDYGFAAFFGIGVGHILGGIDHIAFLLGLLLVAGRPGRSIAAVTGFTVGHSVSLAAAVLGLLQANGRLVEAFIGYTVALVAIEYFLCRHPDTRWAGRFAVTAMFAAWLAGTVAVSAGRLPGDALAMYAGFGLFAACYLLAARRMAALPGPPGIAILIVVTATFGLIHGFGFAGFLMETGLQGDSLLLPLLGFNLGVEAGQLLLLVAAFVAARLAAAARLERLAPAAAAALCGLGVYWFVGRTLAGI